MSKARNLSAFISEAAIDASEIGSNAVTTDKIIDQAVTPAKLHDTLDLSSKTVTLPTGGISGNAINGGVISNFASTGIDDNATSTAITISADGKVGIGTSPNSSYSLAAEGGQVRFRRAGHDIYLNPNYGELNNFSSITSTLDLSIRNGSDVNLVYITQSGNVGIGTTSPLRKLHVADAGDTHIILQSTNAVDNSEIFEIGVGANSTNKVDLTFRTRLNSGSGGAEHMRIANDGYVTTPNQPAVNCRGNGGSQTAAAIITTWIEVTDRANNHSNGRFTAPVAGFYLVTFGVRSQNSSNGTIYAQLWKNGSGHSGASAIEVLPGMNTEHHMGGSQLYLNQNDYVEIYAGNNVHCDGSDHFSVSLLG